MAKLHSEIRIKAVDNITGGSEGDPAKFSLGDVVYDMTSQEFKVLDALGVWQDAITGGGGAVDLSSESITALQDIKANGVTLDGANGEGKILAWSQAENAFVPVDQAAGGGSPFVPNTTDPGQMDGHLIPDANNTYDIGSPEYKVRDMYISDASLWVGDDHKVAVSGGKMRFLKRKKDRIPSGAAATGDSKAQILAFMNELPAPDQPASFEEMELKHWKEYSRRKGGAVPFESIYNKDVDEDWEPYDAATESSYVVRKTNITAGFTKAFDVAVDNKAANSPQPAGSGNAFYIDGVPQPELRLKAGTYRFYQKHFSNPGHPLGFYSQEDKGGAGLLPGQAWKRDDLTQYVSLTSYGNALNASGDLQGEGYYVELVVDETLPAEFWYQCGAHGNMGWKVINEAAGTGGGGASSMGELADVSGDAPSEGDVLVYDDASSEYQPKPVLMDLHNQFASRRIDFSVHQVKEFHSTLRNNFGGRIVIDLDKDGPNAFDPAQGDKLQLDLSQLYDMNPMPKTMNFEIFSVGTDPFEVEVANPASGPTTGAQILHSDIQPTLSVNEDATSVISIDEGQMMIIYCNGASWYYEIRSGL